MKVPSSSCPSAKRTEGFAWALEACFFGGMSASGVLLMQVVPVLEFNNVRASFDFASRNHTRLKARANHVARSSAPPSHNTAESVAAYRPFTAQRRSLH